MKLHIANTAGLNLFTAYGDDYAAVNHEKHEKNLILLPESIIPAWTGATVNTLTEADINILLGLDTEIILLGTGKSLRFPPGALLRPFAPAGIGLDGQPGYRKGQSSIQFLEIFLGEQLVRQIS